MRHGALRVSEPLIGVVDCHGTRCQHRTGTAAAPSAGATPGSFEVLSGEEHIRRWNAGDGNDKVFCGICGSALFSQNPDNPDVMCVRIGSFDGDPDVRAGARVHVVNAAVWEPIPDDGIARYPGFFDA